MNNNNKIGILFVASSIAMYLMLGSLSYQIMPTDIPLQIHMATAQNDAVGASANSSMILGSPIFTEHDKATPPKPVIVNGTHGLQVFYSGSGVIKGINFEDNGAVFIVPRNDGAADLSGHAVITTNSEEKGSYTFYSIGHTDANGTTRDNGAAFFHTNTNGTGAIINNLVVVFKDQFDKAGNGVTIGWEWK